MGSEHREWIATRTRHADLNQYSRANWNQATNNPVASGVAQGSMIDFDAGYDALIGVTQSVESAGGYMESSRSTARATGNSQTTATEEAFEAIGRTHHFHMNGHNNMERGTPQRFLGSSSRRDRQAGRSRRLGRRSSSTWMERR